MQEPHICANKMADRKTNGEASTSRKLNFSSDEDFSEDATERIIIIIISSSSCCCCCCYHHHHHHHHYVYTE
jgi:hypothetical protein